MKKLLIDATGSSSWIGGVYHKKNILFSLLQNGWIRDNYRIILVTNPEHKSVFEVFENDVTIITITCKGERDRKIRLMMIAFLHGCKVAFPNFDVRVCRLLHIKGINWVPDYQHYHYRDFFPSDELEARIATDRRTADTEYPLLLSSKACLDDFREFVSEDKKNIYVVPFVSFIESEIRSITDEYLSGVCDKYGIQSGRYIMTANQFWQHKNHKVVLEAVRLVADRLDQDTRFVFTGQVSDYRDGGYIDNIRELLDTPGVKERCICTGFIERKEQLALMKGARLLIQPSLFEGWGTVLEDAKVLDKTVLLSDIPVHREQMNDKCTLFDPHDPAGLADKIISVWDKVGPDDVEAGIRRMYESAGEYSKGFENLLKEDYVG